MREWWQRYHDLARDYRPNEQDKFFGAPLQLLRCLDMLRELKGEGIPYLIDVFERCPTGIYVFAENGLPVEYASINMGRVKDKDMPRVIAALKRAQTAAKGTRNYDAITAELKMLQDAEEAEEAEKAEKAKPKKRKRQSLRNGNGHEVKVENERKVIQVPPVGTNPYPHPLQETERACCLRRRCRVANR